MDRFEEMRLFLAVKQAGNLTGAAKRAGVSRSTATKVIANIEQRLNVRLINRTTHHVSFTAAGEEFAHEANIILSRVSRLQKKLGKERMEMEGEIQIGSPPSFACFHLLPAIREFRNIYPGVIFDVSLDNGAIDLARDALDISIRIAPYLNDSSLIARPLAKISQALVAAPSYLKIHEAPKIPNELVEHNCLVHTIKSPSGYWSFNNGQRVHVTGTISSNLGETLHHAALSGEGISIHPKYMIYKELETGALVQVLPGYVPEELSIYVVYMGRQFHLNRVLTFIEFLRDWVRAKKRDMWSERPL